MGPEAVLVFIFKSLWACCSWWGRFHFLPPLALRQGSWMTRHAQAVLGEVQIRSILADLLSHSYQTQRGRAKQVPGWWMVVVEGGDKQGGLNLNKGRNIQDIQKLAQRIAWERKE